LVNWNATLLTLDMEEINGSCKNSFKARKSNTEMRVCFDIRASKFEFSMYARFGPRKMLPDV